MAQSCDRNRVNEMDKLVVPERTVQNQIYSIITLPTPINLHVLCISVTRTALSGGILIRDINYTMCKELVSDVHEGCIVKKKGAQDGVKGS